MSESHRDSNQIVMTTLGKDPARAAEGTENTMPYILDAVRAYATVGEICLALKDVFGSYRETCVI